MKKFLLIVAIILVATTDANAQFSVTGGPNGVSGTMSMGYGGFSSTPQEGWLKGLGVYWSGYGNYLQSLGNYENLHESARRQYLKMNMTEFKHDGL